MQKEHLIPLPNTNIVCALRKRRGQKNMKLRVMYDGTVTLSVPWWISRAAAARYLESKRTWLVDACRGTSPATALARRTEGVAHYKKHKEQARALVQERLATLNAAYGFVWGRVAIRRNSTSWGSCSSKKNLNFDYRILFLSPHLQDYLIVHELCHLQEMNHSPRFWALVAKAIPAYKQCRKELRSQKRQK